VKVKELLSVLHIALFMECVLYLQTSMLGMKRDCGGAAGILGGFRAAVKQVGTKTQNNNNNCKL